MYLLILWIHRSLGICSRKTTRKSPVPRDNAGWTWSHWTSKEDEITGCRLIRLGDSCAGFRGHGPSKTWKRSLNRRRYKGYRSCTSNCCINIFTERQAWLFRFRQFSRFNGFCYRAPAIYTLFRATITDCPRSRTHISQNNCILIHLHSTEVLVS